MKTRFFSVIFTCLIISNSVIGQQLSQAIQSAIGEQLYMRFTGTCYAKPTGANSYLLLVNTTGQGDNFDKALIVFSEGNQVKPMVDEQATYEFFIPENRRYVVIYNQKNNKIFVAGLTDQNAKDRIGRFKGNAAIKSALTNQDALGHGLSYMSGSWSKAKVKESKYKMPFNTLQYSNNLDPAAASMLPPDDGGGGVSCAQGACTSGGAGSSSCSITESPLNQTCEVTCNSGYYACCVSSTVRCYCCRIQ